MVNLPAILIANGLGATLMLILIFSNRADVRSVFLDEKLFYGMCLLTLALCVGETATFLLDGQLFPGARPLLRLLNTLLFVGNSLFSFLWTVYVDYKLFGRMDRLRRIYPIVALPALVVAVLAVGNLFGDVFFTLTEDNLYRRTPLVALTYLVTYGYLAGGAGMVFRYRHRVDRYLFLPVAVFLAPIFLGSLLQMHFYGITLIWVSVALGVTSLYINIQNETSLVDSLTKLYNRDYLTRYLRSAAQHPPADGLLAGLMIDLNSFKEINDTYGHSEGDAALRLVGRLLMEVLPRRAFAARYGGDEFIVLAVVQHEAQLHVLMDTIQGRAAACSRAQGLPYELSLSMGETFFRPYSDTQDSFLRRMDERMYENKRRHYSRAGYDRRRPRAATS